MNKKAILFDCFGVITDRVLGNWVPKGMSLGFDPTEIFRKLDMGEMTEVESLQFFSQTVDRPIDEVRKEIDSHFKPNYELLEFIKDLKQNGHRIILLSNASNDFFERLIPVEYPQFLESFDDVIISSKIQMIKPNKDIYLYALEKNSLKPEDAVFIDDNKDNIVGAEDVGIYSILFKDNTQLKNDLKEIGITV